MQCLFPGAAQDKGKHKDGKCQRDFVCPHPSHENYSVRKHVLICHEHRNLQANQDLLNNYKEKFINKQPELPLFAKEIKVTFLSSYRSDKSKEDTPDGENTEEAIFMLQNIMVDNQEYSIFYDSGCSQMVCRYDAIQRMCLKSKTEDSWTTCN